MQDAFEEFANNYEHMSEVPEEFSPLPGVFVRYKVTDMVWNRDLVLFQVRGQEGRGWQGRIFNFYVFLFFVVFQANATFSALVDGVNRTFVPKGAQSEVSSSSDCAALLGTLTSSPLSLSSSPPPP